MISFKEEISYELCKMVLLRTLTYGLGGSESGFLRHYSSFSTPVGRQVFSSAGLCHDISSGSIG